MWPIASYCSPLPVLETALTRLEPEDWRRAVENSPRAAVRTWPEIAATVQQLIRWASLPPLAELRWRRQCRIQPRRHGRGMRVPTARLAG